jgi:hypothetical protein
LARTSPILRCAIQEYALKVGITLKAEYEGDNLPSAMSLVRRLLSRAEELVESVQNQSIIRYAETLQ